LSEPKALFENENMKKEIKEPGALFSNGSNREPTKLFEDSNNKQKEPSVIVFKEEEKKATLKVEPTPIIFKEEPLKKEKDRPSALFKTENGIAIIDIEEKDLNVFEELRDNKNWRISVFKLIDSFKLNYKNIMDFGKNCAIAIKTNSEKIFAISNDKVWEDLKNDINAIKKNLEEDESSILQIFKRNSDNKEKDSLIRSKIEKIEKYTTKDIERIHKQLIEVENEIKINMEEITIIILSIKVMRNYCKEEFIKNLSNANSRK